LVSEGESLVALLERLNQSDALVAGRVFVNGRRAEADVSLEVGARVDVYAARGDAAAVSILARHRGLVFAEKPVGIATEPERRGSEHTLLHRVAELLSVQPARVNALTRLDVGVSGVVLLALDAEARQRVQALRAAGAFERGYVALASAAPVPDAGSWNEAIGRDNRGPRRALDRNGDPAETRYLVTGKSASGEAVLAFRPLTGRTHQLRVHASAHGAPLLGDVTYGASKRLVLGGGRVLALPRIYLHAAWMALGDALRVEAPLPEEFGSTWSALGGEAEALERAVVDPVTL
jgi:23S rRNA-/tRNA-specific pseudouridylate synthase